MLNVILDSTESKGPKVKLPVPVQTSSEEMNEVSRQLNELQKRIELINTLMRISESTGNHVTLRRDYGFIPVVIGSDNRPVLLLRLMEALDGMIDYAELREQFPSLSFSQIDGVLRFFKKISQINSHGIDLEDMEDEFDSDDAELIETLRAGSASQEKARVLFNDK